MNQSRQRKKLLFFVFLFIFGILSILIIGFTGDSTQGNRITFIPLLQILGKAPQALSRSVTKMLPIDSVDEGELGKRIRPLFFTGELTVANDRKSLTYLNSIVKHLQKFRKKPFEYEVRILNSLTPNAMAFPGGLIVVTKGLLNMTRSESELVSVLAHEMGHIELSHCFDSVKYEILSRKIAHNSLGAIADFARKLLIQHSFSKNQEDEADNYGFQLLTNSEYDPSAMAKAFKGLEASAGRGYDGPSGPIRDYFRSHPPLAQRILKFSAEAESWWRGRVSERRYIGVENLKERVDFSARDFGDSEWTSSSSN
jgi:beta-barrel assembly-enhancing protease